jgi:hypothetical protein
VPAGEAHLGLWAGTALASRRNTNAFFRLYTGEPHRINEKKGENLSVLLSSPGLRHLCSYEGSRIMCAFVVPLGVVGYVT